MNAPGQRDAVATGESKWVFESQSASELVSMTCMGSVINSDLRFLGSGGLQGS